MTITRRQLIIGAGAALVAGVAPVSAKRAPKVVALVTADTEAAIVAVDALTRRVVARIPCRPEPRSIERVGRSGALVAHTMEGAVSLIDGRALRVGAVLDGFREPRYAAVARDARHAYITDSAAGEVVTIDLRRARVVARTEVGGPARHLGLGADGRTLWTALGSKADEIAVLDLADAAHPRLRRRFRPPFRAHDVAATPRGGRFWVTSGDRRTVAVYEDSSSEPRITLEADAPPQHVAFAGEIAYIASGDDGTLRAHRVDDGRRMWTAAIPNGSYNVTASDGFTLTPSLSRGTLSIVGAGSRIAVVREIARSAHDVCVILTR